MTKVDKITFWIIEFLIIALTVIGGYRIWNICHEVPDIYEVAFNKNMIWPMRLYRYFPETIVSLILVGSIMNIMALYGGRLKYFKKSSCIEKVLIRLCIATIGLILSCHALRLIFNIIK